jgi:hypothetical protein
MPNKKELDAEYWKSRRERVRTPALAPHTEPAVLPSEDPAEYAALAAAYYARFNPTRPEERAYVDDIVYCEWILRRLSRTESELNTFVHNNCHHTHPDFVLGQSAAEKPRVFNALQWRFVSTRKALREAFAALRELRANPIRDGVLPRADVD